MSHVTLASLLTDYGVSDEPDMPEVAPAPIIHGSDGMTPNVGFERLPESSTSVLEDYFKRGFEEGQREAEARMAHDLGEQQAAAEMKLDQARKTWAADFGQVLAQELVVGVENMHNVLADSFVDVLVPIIRDEARSDAVRRIAEAIRTTAPSDWDGPIIVEGPADLVKALQENLGDMKAIVEPRTRDGLDISVRINETILETQLEAWGDAVKRILS
ncbi:MAG: hypothetical protein JXQ99_11130 [Hyphomicrobiaceae bacterium]